MTMGLCGRYQFNWQRNIIKKNRQHMVDLFSLPSVDYRYEAKRRHQEIESGSQAARS